MDKKHSWENEIIKIKICALVSISNKMEYQGPDFLFSLETTEIQDEVDETMVSKTLDGGQ